MKHFIYSLFVLVLISCGHDADTVNLGLDDVYRVARMQKLTLEPALSGNACRWTVNGEVVADSRRFVFVAAEEGTYKVRFEIVDAAAPCSFDFEVIVMHEEVEYSPYIARVYEYRPAPGQFINEMPKYEDGDTEADMTRKAEECIAGTNDVLISLGAFGGYVTFGFDHTVVNVAGEYDFRIWGNAFYEVQTPELTGGSCEAGIVMVSLDENGNGLPDDTWYELAGSDYRNPATRHAYSITYHRPAADKPKVPGDSFVDDAEYIRWEDSEGASGYFAKNIFHRQDYYPRWLAADSYGFEGTCLPPNSKDTAGNGSHFLLCPFAWGYADNHPNDMAELNSFKIDWAVDADGNPVALPGIDFVRVYTGLNQSNGWIGETSTELSKAADLHL